MKKGLAMVLVLALNTGFGSATMVPGRWEKMETLETGTAVIVELKSGDRMEGRFLGTGPEDVFLATEGDVQIKLGKPAIRRITGQKRTEVDSVKNGVLIGALIGAAVGSPWLILGLASRKPWFSEFDRAIGTGVMLMSVGIGTGIGLVADRARKSHEVYYQAAEKQP